MSDPEVTGTPEPADEEREVRIRRAPRLLPFLLTGAGIGLLVAAIVAATTPASADVSQLQAFGYLAIIFVVAFGSIAGIIVVVLDAVLARRSRNAVVLVEEVEEDEEDEDSNSADDEAPSTASAPIDELEASPAAGTDSTAETPSERASTAAPGDDSDLK